MLPVLQVGPLAIQLSGLLMLGGLWLGQTLAERHAENRGVPANDLYNLVFVALIVGLMGARLVYLFTYPQAFIANPISVVSLNPGLLDPLGGLAIGLLAGAVFAQRKRLALLPTLDALTPLLAVVWIAQSLAHLASGAAFGAPADLPWSIELWGAWRHPTQLYATLLGAAGLWFFWPGRKLWQEKPPGAYALAFIAYAAAARLFVEGFRGDSLLLPGGLRSAQVIAWGILAAALWGYARLNNTRKNVA